MGAGPAVPNPGGACSGYLVRHGDASVLLDCGSGVVGRLRQVLPLSQVGAIVISHLHPDHYIDLIAYYYALKYTDRAPAPPPLFLPPGGQAHLRRLGELVSGEPGMFDQAFAVREYAAGASPVSPGLDFAFFPVQHYVASHAMRVSANGGPALVFSSDVAPCDALVEAAHGAALLLCESALVDRSEDETDPLRRGHMLAAEAGELARRAGAERLLLTHYRADRDGLADHHRASAARTFGQPVELAQEGQTYRVGQPRR